MRFDIILAGVGGQGILTTARAISLAAMRRGWTVKQAELHGMAQRGGAVQSHLRLSDQEILSDLIPLGSADLILAVEPLEALRYRAYLSESGTIVANTTPLKNIPDYGETDTILDRIARHPRHVLVDANHLAGLAGASRSLNMVMFGAASGFLDLAVGDCLAAIGEMFADKGPTVVRANQRAFELGRHAAWLYQEALGGGIGARAAREQIARLTVDQFEAASDHGVVGADDALTLSSAQAEAIDRVLAQAVRERRQALLEPEVYSILAAVGAVQPPRHRMVSDPAEVTPELLSGFPGDRLVLKIVSPQIVHKSDAGGVAVVPKDVDGVRRRVAEMIDQARSTADRVDGVLLVEFVEHVSAALGGELFVGIRATREFGPVIAAGLGGVDTEYLAAKLRPGAAAAKALALEVGADAFFQRFQETAAYEILSGRTRGHFRLVSDGDMRRCFRAFLALAQRLCVARTDGGPELAELEVNPFAFRRRQFVPLDGRGRLARAARPALPRPREAVDRLLVPRSIAMLGVSAKERSFGRIILNNILACGFPIEALHVIKSGPAAIDGVRCVPDLASLPDPVDLLVITTAAANVPAAVDGVLATRCAHSTIVITGGLGERAGTEDVHETLQQRIHAAREKTGDGPVFLGENCLGVRSRPGRYDTFFIPEKKLAARRSAPPRRLGLVSQSGAFIVSRLSNIATLDPVFAVSLGNQLDLTLSDLVRAVGRRDEVDVLGVYVEGFRDLDGLAFVHCVRQITESGKLVVFYKAGRTAPARTAMAGHTASIAGDYDVCVCAVEQAGAIITETVKEFEQVLEIAIACHRRPVRGRRIAVLTNAGFEAVAMADAIVGPRHTLEMARWSPDTDRRLRAIIGRHGLDTLVNVANPMDVTPMAGDEVFEELIRAMLEEPDTDAAIVSIVPLTPELRTTADEIDDPRSLCRRIPVLAGEYEKPLILVIDAGPLYDPYVERVRTPAACRCSAP